MSLRKVPKPRYDQDLVADQPGRTVFFSGILVALVLGLILRGLISPQRIHAMVETASSNIHKDVQVHFESAHVSLSQRGLPRLSVVISNVQMSSENRCWGRPQLSVQEIVLPVSITALLLERQPLKRIVAKNTEVHFRSEVEKCTAEEQQQSASVTPATPQAVTLVHRRTEPDTTVNTAIDTLEIDNLKILYQPDSKFNFEVADLIMKVRSHQPKVIALEARTHAAREGFARDFTSHGKVFVEYKEFPEKDLVVQFSGNWREGNYYFQAAYNFSDQFLNSSAELKHIPAASVISFLNDYGVLREDLDGRRIWITLKVQSQGNVSNWKKLPLAITNFHLEGDLGEIRFNQLVASQLQPFVFEPLKADIKKLQFDRLLEVIKRPRTLDFLGRLGEFNGTLDLVNENELRLSGEHSGLEFIFSNRGQRESQVISALKGEMQMKNNQWSFLIKDVALQNGNFNGEVRMQADRDFKDINLKLNADELTLSPAVQSLMSGGGSIGKVQSQVNVHLVDGKVTDLKGTIRSPMVYVDFIRFEKLDSRFNMANDVVQMDLKAQAFEVEKESRAFSLLQQVLQMEDSPNIFRFKNLSGHFDVKANKEMTWRQLSGVYTPSMVKILSDGQWNADGQLDGNLIVRRQGRPTRWQIFGHRDTPQVRETNEISSAGP